MAIDCGQCPQTFRTENGRTWHVKHIHDELADQAVAVMTDTDDLAAMIENEITAQVHDPDSPLNVHLDQRVAGVLTEVNQRIADSDQAVRAHIEHRIGDSLQAVTAMRRESSGRDQDRRDGMIVSAFESCSLNRGHLRALKPQPKRWDPSSPSGRAAIDGMVAEALSSVELHPRAEHWANILAS